MKTAENTVNSQNNVHLKSFNFKNTALNENHFSLENSVQLLDMSTL